VYADSGPGILQNGSDAMDSVTLKLLKVNEVEDNHVGAGAAQLVDDARKQFIVIRREGAPYHYPGYADNFLDAD